MTFLGGEDQFYYIVLKADKSSATMKEYISDYNFVWGHRIRYLDDNNIFTSHYAKIRKDASSF